MYTRIYKTSLIFRLMAITLALFVLAATSVPLGYGTVTLVHAEGHEGMGPAPEAPPNPPAQRWTAPSHRASTLTHTDPALGQCYN